MNLSTALHTAQGSLFDTDDLLPPGLSFAPDFISRAEEAALLQIIHALPVRQARYHQYTARRRVYSFGAEDEAGGERLAPHERRFDLPPPVQALRARLAGWAGIQAAEFAQVMVSEYPRGAPLGWHRDAPHYELIAGVSLASTARLRFRPWAGMDNEAAAASRSIGLGLDLEPRSAYVMRGPARWAWQHSVPPVAALRFSITMRTLRAP